ncbi:hypothetical protein Anapl_11237 [Anas platyrhynchos]|uniref:Uncharacterized protein n=1 Tax=Anas platyrhynchos TaxID=8839 RepID=R0M1J8_ANAPL|nr:hypothetical protein Anapl_11237 [Anas platyrhynchos]
MEKVWTIAGITRRPTKRGISSRQQHIVTGTYLALTETELRSLLELFLSSLQATMHLQKNK